MLGEETTGLQGPETHCTGPKCPGQVSPASRQCWNRGVVTEWALLGLLTAEQGHSWPWAHTRAPEAPGAVAGEATSRGQPMATGVRGPQQQALLTPSPPHRAADNRAARAKPRTEERRKASPRGHGAGEHPAGSKRERDPRTPSVQLLRKCCGGRSTMTPAWNLQTLRRRPGGVSTWPRDRG